jgi:hypothetical protein
MNKETEAKYDELYESYLMYYDCDILKRKDFFNILNKYSEDLPKDYILEYYDTEMFSFEEQLITDIIHENCDNAYIYISGDRVEIDGIDDISEKDFNYIVKFCNKYNLDIVNIDDREDK